MTDVKTDNSILIKKYIVVDILMSLIAFLIISSGCILLRAYLPLADMGYNILMTPAVAVILFTIIRRLRIPNLFIFLAHIAVVIIYALVMVKFLSVFGVVYMTFTVVLNLVYSMFQSVRQRYFAFDREMFVSSLIINAVIVGILSYAELKDAANLVLINALISVTLFAVARHLDTLEIKYFHTVNSPTQNVKAVKQQNQRTLILILAGIALALTMLFVLPVDKFSEALYNGAHKIGSLIGSLLPDETLDEPDEDLEREKKMAEEDTEGQTLPLYIEMMADAAILLVMAALFILCIVLIKSITHMSDKAKTLSDDSVVDIIEDIKPEKTGFFLSGYNFGKGYEKKIRKQYYARVKKAMKDGTPVTNASSPSQIENMILSSGDNSISKLTAEYEAVRYGGKKN